MGVSLAPCGEHVCILAHADCVMLKRIRLVKSQDDKVPVHVGWFVQLVVSLVVQDGFLLKFKSCVNCVNPSFLRSQGSHHRLSLPCQGRHNLYLFTVYARSRF